MQWSAYMLTAMWFWVLNSASLCKSTRQMQFWASVDLLQRCNLTDNLLLLFFDYFF